MEMLVQSLDDLLHKHSGYQLQSIGISCGGPLDSEKGFILSPPNLPNWDHIDVITPFRERFAVPVALQNDANACALAEWMWGAGKGTNNMIFLTFGTGMGAGLILNGQLYTGTNDMAGEVGHIRLAEEGPLGYGKAGSFEGFCSGGGIERLAKQMTREWLESGKLTMYCYSLERIDTITAETVAKAAQQGDHLANEIYRIVGTRLGQALAMLVDILNPERIVIGSIYARQQSLLEPYVRKSFEQEALMSSQQVCSIVPAGLQESIGDLASLSIASNI